LQQTVDSITTNYTLDLEGGLTQVLADGTNTYLYGASRISQQAGSSTEYFLGDALGSVRQMTDASGEITLAKAYEPYGEVMNRAGSGASSYGFTGEWTDSYIKLIYLRSRYYSPATGRFLTKDSWQGDYNRPLSLNGWNYVEGNPINYTDPNGNSPRPDTEFQACISYSELSLMSPSMREDVCNMISDLEDQGYLTQIPDIEHITQGNRTKKQAHIFSTAYHILHDFVSIDGLRRTRKDLDGNTWYKGEWDSLYCAGQNIYVDPQLRMQWLGYLGYLIKKNASELARDTRVGGWRHNIYTPFGIVSDVSYALEGYERGTPERLPNSSLPGISKHVYGQAIDVGRYDFDVLRIGAWQGTNSDVDKIAHKWGLRRPLNNSNYAWYTEYEPAEWWHFEQLWIKE